MAAEVERTNKLFMMEFTVDFLSGMMGGKWKLEMTLSIMKHAVIMKRQCSVHNVIGYFRQVPRW